MKLRWFFFVFFAGTASASAACTARGSVVRVRSSRERSEERGRGAPAMLVRRALEAAPRPDSRSDGAEEEDGGRPSRTALESSFSRAFFREAREGFLPMGPGTLRGSTARCNGAFRGRGLPGPKERTMLRA